MLTFFYSIYVNKYSLKKIFEKCCFIQGYLLILHGN